MNTAVTRLTLATSILATPLAARAESPFVSPGAYFEPIQAGEKASEEGVAAVEAVNRIILKEFQQRLGKPVISRLDFIDAEKLEELCAYFGCDPSAAVADPSQIIVPYLERIPMRLSGALSKTGSNYVLSLDAVKTDTLQSKRAVESKIPLNDAALAFGAEVATARLFDAEVSTPNHFLRAWIPGYAQFTKNQSAKGSLIVMGEIGLVAGGLIAMYMESEKREEIRNPNTIDALRPGLRDEAEQLELIATSALIGAGALYLYNLFDGMFAKDDVHYTLYE